MFDYHSFSMDIEDFWVENIHLTTTEYDIDYGTIDEIYSYP